MSASSSTLTTPIDEKSFSSSLPLYTYAPLLRPPAPTRPLPLPAVDLSLESLSTLSPSLKPLTLTLPSGTPSTLTLTPPTPLSPRSDPLPPTDADLDAPLIDFKALRNWRTYVQRKHITKYLVLLFLLGTTIPVAIEHTKLVNWLHPYIDKLKHLPAGWLIPVVILVIISFPPLFGHEVIAVLVGLVWGFGMGFAIVASGSVVGEIGNFYAFRYFLFKHGLRAERTNLRYACLARVVRQGGFVIAVVARLSVIPGHLTTAVFSTCGMNFWVFTAAAILSMPKQMATVYLGVVLYVSADGHTTPRTQALSACIVIITIMFSIIAGVYIYWKMALMYPVLIAERRVERAKRRLEAGEVVLEIPGLGYEGAGVEMGEMEPKAPGVMVVGEDLEANVSSSSLSLPTIILDEKEKESPAEPAMQGLLTRLVRGRGRGRPRAGRAVSDVVLPVVAPREGSPV